MIVTEGLTKRFAEVDAVMDLNLHVRKGEIYGFLGPNGAGKSTTISMVLGLLEPTAGKIIIFGEDPRSKYFDVKRRIGVVPEHLYFYEEMTAQEYLEFFARLYKVGNAKARIAELLDRVELADRARECLRGYSKGMKQKIAIAKALLPDPELLIMDEPVTSLDPYGVKEVRDIIMEEHQNGRTIMVSSHILSEVERTCSRVGIIFKGRLVAEDDMESLKRKLQKDVTMDVELVGDADAVAETLKTKPFVKAVARTEKGLSVTVSADNDYRADVSRAVSASKASLLGLTTDEMSLEEAFMTITEHNISLLTKEVEGNGAAQ